MMDTKAIWNRLFEIATPEQARLLSELDAETSHRWTHFAEQCLAEQARHLGLTAPVVNLLTPHILEQRPDQVGVCCAGPEEEERP
jgi:hypothetical protein